MTEKTLVSLFLSFMEKYKHLKGLFYTKIKDEYIPFTNKDLIRQVYLLIKFFRTSKLIDGDKISILSESRVEWVIVDFACMFCKFVSVPIYTSLSNLQIKYILADSGSKVCFVSNMLLLNKVLSIIDDLPDLKQVIIFNEYDPEKPSDKSIKNFTEIIASENELNEKEIMDELIDKGKHVDNDALMTIIYTSGTTGVPKGVMLSHGNVYSNIVACQKVLPINESDIFLSYLPYSHIYERTAGYYLPLFCGAKIYYAQSIDTIASQFTEVRPTFVITVPRLLDKIYNRLMKSGDEMKEGLRKKLFTWAVKIANDTSITKDALKWKIADKLIYKKIRAKTGGNVRYFVSGGGALNKAVGKFFDNIGITILEGYGMTETSPVIAVNPPDKNKYGTVGKPLDGVSVKLSDENEILVQGEIVMIGYYKDDKNTTQTIKNNWLHTGDIGKFDSDGYLKITDRKKSLIKTSGGKYVAPAQIEELIGRLTYVENVLVVGDGRMYVTALIVPVKKELCDLATKNNIHFSTYPELIKDNSLNKIIQRDIEKLQKDLSSHEKIRKFGVIEGPFSIETGELTPTMKVKRKFVEEKFKDNIEKMYTKI